MRAAPILALALAASPADAQDQPAPAAQDRPEPAAQGQWEPAAPGQPEQSAADPRVQVVTYHPDQVVTLQGAPGYQINIEFAADEAIESVAVGDSGAWQATANRRGDHLFVKPVSAGISTNMTVVTSVRVYMFELVPAFSGNIPFTVRFRYPDAERAAAEQAVTETLVAGRYRMSGSRSLWPSRIWDDGFQTYIAFAPDAALPATYTVDDRGQETLVNGGMRGGLFVIDSVSRRLVFRIDRHVAHARRVAQSIARAGTERTAD